MNQEIVSSQAPAKTQKLWTYHNGAWEKREDLLAVEAPLEIRLGYKEKSKRTEKSLSITMRTPGQDLELVMGFLLGEGIIQKKEEVVSIQHCRKIEKEESLGNVVRVELIDKLIPDFKKLERNFLSNSSCGICGKASIEAVQDLHCNFLEYEGKGISPQILQALSQKLSKQQYIFKHTGGLHAAALFDEEGHLLLLKEDVGRHNALDKLIGAALYQDLLSLKNCILLLSGRISFELVQKALAAELGLIVAVGAPSSLAVELAEASGITLVGFAKEKRFNLYTHPQRIQIELPR
ncbi:MAG: formate dehydrogenase accessory sulfurtransferase FdhD [Bacteroidota bacterium]